MLHKAISHIKKLTRFQIKLKKRFIVLLIALAFFGLSHLVTNEKQVFQLSLFNWKAILWFVWKDDIILKTQAANTVSAINNIEISENKPLDDWNFPKTLEDMLIFTKKIDWKSLDKSFKKLEALGPSEKVFDFFSTLNLLWLAKTREFWGNGLLTAQDCFEIQKKFLTQEKLCELFSDKKDHQAEKIFVPYIYEISNTYLLVRLTNPTVSEADRAALLFDKRSNKYIILESEKIWWNPSYYDWVLYFFDKNYFLKTAYNIVTRTYKSYEKINKDKDWFLGFNQWGRLIWKQVDGEKIIKLDGLPILEDRYLKYGSIDANSWTFAFIDQEKPNSDLIIYYGKFEHNKTSVVKKYITIKADLPSENCLWNMKLRVENENLFIYPLKKKEDSEYCWWVETVRFDLQTEKFLFKTNKIDRLSLE